MWHLFLNSNYLSKNRIEITDESFLKEKENSSNMITNIIESNDKN